MTADHFDDVTVTNIMNLNNKEIEDLINKIKLLGERTNKTLHDIVDEFNLP